MKIKNIFKYLLNENIITEKAFNVSHLPDTTILINRNNKLTLYDVNYLNNENKIDGVIGFMVIGHDRGELFVEMVAAKKGFGPLMYELGLANVFPNSLMPDIEGNVSEAALRMWDYFYNGNNSEVEIKPIDKNDPMFREYLGKYNIEDNPEIIRLFNARYYLDNSNDYYYLESRTDDFLDEYGDSGIEMEITLLGNDFFNKMY